MSIEQQAYMAHAMSGKNPNVAMPNPLMVSKNTRLADMVPNVNPSPANQLVGIIDGSKPIEGTNIGIKY